MVLALSHVPSLPHSPPHCGRCTRHVCRRRASRPSGPAHAPQNLSSGTPITMTTMTTSNNQLMILLFAVNAICHVLTRDSRRWWSSRSPSLLSGNGSGDGVVVTHTHTHTYSKLGSRSCLWSVMLWQVENIQTEKWLWQCSGCGSGQSPAMRLSQGLSLSSAYPSASSPNLKQNTRHRMHMKWAWRGATNCIQNKQ